MNDGQYSLNNSSLDAKAADFASKANQYYFRNNEQDNINALKLYRKAIEIDPSLSSAYSGLADVFAQGYDQFGKGDEWLQQSIDNSTQAIEMDPKQSWGYKSLGFSLYLNGQFSESLLALEKANRISPNWAAPLAYSALSHLDSGNLTLAHETALAAVKKVPTNPVNVAILGLCYRELGLTKRAISAFNKSLNIKSDYFFVYNYLAELYLVTGKYEEAQKILNKTIAQLPNSQFAYWIRAQLQLKIGELKEAAWNFKRASLLGGRYELPAKIHFAVLKGDRSQLQILDKELEFKVEHGNQWAELIYSKALISLANDNKTMVISLFKQAIASGVSQKYRYLEHPLLLKILDDDVIKNSIKEIERRNSLTRQKLIKIEHLNREI